MLEQRWQKAYGYLAKSSNTGVILGGRQPDLRGPARPSADAITDSITVTHLGCSSIRRLKRNETKMKIPVVLGEKNYVPLLGNI